MARPKYTGIFVILGIVAFIALALLCAAVGACIGIYK